MKALNTKDACQTAADIDTYSARRALTAALNALDKGNVVLAGNFAETAVDLLANVQIKQINPGKLRYVVAPKEGPTKGNMAALLVSLGVLVWLVVDWLVPYAAEIFQ
jgi:hypothetical protein